MTVGDLKFCHQKKVENAVTFVGLKDDDCPARVRLGDEVWMRYVKGSSIRHADFEWTKGLLV